MPLQDLPSEILDEIVTAIHSSETWTSRPTLQRLALCSRRLNFIVTPVLYRQLYLKDEDRTSKFLGLVLKKPDLATYVRLLSAPAVPDSDISSDEREKEGNEDGKERLSFEDLARTNSAITTLYKASGLRDCDAKAWYSRVKDGYEHSIAALLLLLLPNLGELVINSDRDSRITDAQESIQWALEQVAQCQFENFESAPLQHLKTVSLKYKFSDGRDSGLLPHEVISIFRPISVAHAQIDGLGSGRLGSAKAKLQIEAYTLEVCNSALEKDDVAEFMGCFKSLKVLSYEHNSEKLRGMVQRAIFPAQEFGAAIKHLEPCLEELNLICNYNKGTLGYLATFKKLKVLSIRGSTLFRRKDHQNEGTQKSFHLEIRLSEILPPSLVRLELSLCNPWIIVCVQQLLAQKLREIEWLPGLKTIVLWFNSGDLYGHLGDIARELVEGYKAIGIVLSVRKGEKEVTWCGYGG